MCLSLCSAVRRPHPNSNLKLCSVTTKETKMMIKWINERHEVMWVWVHTGVSTMYGKSFESSVFHVASNDFFAFFCWLFSVSSYVKRFGLLPDVDSEFSFWAFCVRTLVSVSNTESTVLSCCRSLFIISVMSSTKPFGLDGTYVWPRILRNSSNAFLNGVGVRGPFNKYFLAFGVCRLSSTSFSTLTVPNEGSFGKSSFCILPVDCFGVINAPSSFYWKQTKGNDQRSECHSFFSSIKTKQIERLRDPITSTQKAFLWTKRVSQSKIYVCCRLSFVWALKC